MLLDADVEAALRTWWESRQVPLHGSDTGLILQGWPGAVA